VKLRKLTRIVGMALGIAAAYGVRWLLGEWPRLI
jgi:hypothetical protein